MGFWGTLANFFPNLVKSLTKAFPKSDNHKLNMLFDLFGLIALLALAAYALDFSSEKLANINWEQFTDLLLMFGGGLVFWFLFAFLCYITTFFKSA